MLATVLMVHKELGFIGHGITRPGYPIKHIHVTPAGEWRASIQGLIKSAQFVQYFGWKCHIASSPEIGSWGERRTSVKSDFPKVTAESESAPSFE
jgi:hypothetical protein